MMERIKKTLPLIGLLLITGALIHWSVTLEPRPGHTWVSAIGGFLLAAGLLLNLPDIVRFFRSRRGIHGAHYAISVIVLGAVLVMANILANRFNHRIDTTRSHQFSLSEQTIKVLGRVPGEVRATAFFKDTDTSEERARATDLLKEFAAHQPRFRWSLKDPERNPALAQAAGVRAYGQVAVTLGNRTELLEGLDESRLTAALLKLTRTNAKKVYFVSGHGEKSISDQQPQGFTGVVAALRKSNYQVEEINLVTARGVPQDCAVLVVAGPEKDLFPQETSWIQSYQEKGGALFLLNDPRPAVACSSLTEGWGIRLHDDVALDASGLGQLMQAGPNIPLVTRYPDHPITRTLKLMTFFPLARSLALESPAPRGVTVSPIVTMGEAGWGETDFAKLDQTGEAQYDAGKDFAAPLHLGVVAEKEIRKEGKSSHARLAVMGDSDFAANAYFGTQGNGDLFLNIVNWLSQDEDLMGIRPRESDSIPLIASEATCRSVFYVAVILFPMGTALFGTFMILGRRRKR